MKYNDWFDRYATRTGILSVDLDADEMEAFGRAAYNAGLKASRKQLTTSASTPLCDRIDCTKHATHHLCDRHYDQMADAASR